MPLPPLPPSITRAYDYSAFQALNPSTPLPADRHEADYDALYSWTRTARAWMDAAGANTALALTADAGAALVTATGGTTLRSLGAHLADDGFNVRDFGAVGNGTTSDVAAVQAAVNAITAAQAGAVVFPPGTYNMGGSFTTNNGRTPIFRLLPGASLSNTVAFGMEYPARSERYDGRQSRVDIAGVPAGSQTIADLWNIANIGAAAAYGRRINYHSTAYGANTFDILEGRLGVWDRSVGQDGGQALTDWVVAISPKVANNTNTRSGTFCAEYNVVNRYGAYASPYRTRELAQAEVGHFTALLQVVPEGQNFAQGGATYDALAGVVFGPSSVVGAHHLARGARSWIGILGEPNAITGGGYAIRWAGNDVAGTGDNAAAFIYVDGKWNAGIDLSAATFTGNAFASPGFSVSGTGATEARRSAFGTVSGAPVLFSDAQPVLRTQWNPTFTSTGRPGVLMRADVRGTVNTGPVYVTQYAIDNDSVNAASAAGGGLLGHYIGHTLNTGVTGGRTTRKTLLHIATPLSVAERTFLVAGADFAEAVASAGGTAGLGNARGALFGYNSSARLRAGAGGFWEECVGAEFNVGMVAGTGALRRVGAQIVLWDDAEVQGTTLDAGLMIGVIRNGTAVGFKHAIALGSPAGWWPIASDGTIIGTTPLFPGGPSRSAAHGVDFSDITFTGNAFASPGFSVNSAGRVTAPRYFMTDYAAVNYADDAAAAAGGVVLGGLYHNAGAVRVRIV